MFGQPKRSLRTRLIIAVIGTVVLVGLFAISDLPFFVLVLLIGIQWMPVWTKQDGSSRLAALLPNLRNNRFWFGVLAVSTLLLIVSLLIQSFT